MTTATGETWIKTRDNRTGRQLAVAVPSQSDLGKYNLVTAFACDCKGWKYRSTCRHLTAVRAEVAKVKAPLAEGGAAHLAVQRAAGNWPAESTTERRSHLAAEYASIFGSDGEG